MSLEQTLRRELNEHRAYNGRWLLTMRLGAVGLIFGVALYQGVYLAQEDWRVYVPIFAVYFTVAAIFGLVALWSGRVQRWAGISLPILDVPAVFALQMAAMYVSPSPGGIAGFTLAVYCAILSLAAFSLNGWLTFATAVVSTFFSQELLAAAEISAGGRISAFIVLWLAFAACALLVRRSRFLIESVARQTTQRERLGRYFSPAVAERLQTQVAGQASV